MILVGKILSPVGVNGLVLIRSFMENDKDILNFSRLYDKNCKNSFKPIFKSRKKDNLIVELSGVDSRVKADGIKGHDLYADEAEIVQLQDKDEFYHKDLIGLEVRNSDNKKIGRVVAVHNFGASDLLEVDYEAVIKDNARPKKIKRMGMAKSRDKPEGNKEVGGSNKALNTKVKQDYCPFSKEVIKEVDLKAGIIIVELPLGLFEDIA